MYIFFTLSSDSFTLYFRKAQATLPNTNFCLNFFLLFFFLLSDSLKQSRSSLDSWWRSTPESIRSWALEPNKPILFLLLLLYISVCLLMYLFCHSHRPWTVNFPYKNQYCYSYPLMITHNDHSQPISSRFSCDFLNIFHSSMMSSRLFPFRFCMARTLAISPTWVHISLRIP